MRRVVWALAIGMLFAAAPSAHHSYAGYATTMVDVEGVLEAFEYINPHSFVKIRSDEGVLYVGEWTAIRRLQQYGVQHDTLKKGDRLVVTGLPRLDMAQSGLITIRAMRRPSDGWSWEPNVGVRIPGPARATGGTP
jgi:hypothetical protein